MVSVPSAARGWRLSGSSIRDQVGGGRQENAERRALAEFAFDFDPAFVLLDDAVNRGEAEAGAFAEFLGGEKRLENARDIFRRNAHAGVGVGEADKASRARVGELPDVPGIHFARVDADGQGAARAAWRRAN